MRNYDGMWVARARALENNYQWLQRPRVTTDLTKMRYLAVYYTCEPWECRECPVNRKSGPWRCGGIRRRAIRWLYQNDVGGTFRAGDLVQVSDTPGGAIAGPVRRFVCEFEGRIYVTTRWPAPRHEGQLVGWKYAIPFVK